MMKILPLALVMLISTCFCSVAQINFKPGKWSASLFREDGIRIPLELAIQNHKGKSTIYIVNGTERLMVDAPVVEGDSLIIKMPVFESYFKVKLIGNNKLKGYWIKGGSAKNVIIPFEAYAAGTRFSVLKAVSNHNLTGKWNIQFLKADQTTRPAIGNFVQKNNVLSGSVLTPTGDYRYMDGLVYGDSLIMSTFDGIHALLFKAKVEAGKIKGTFYSSASPSETWSGVKDADITLTAPVTSIKEGSDGKLNFAYLDLEGKKVSLADDRFKNKVVIIQLMGSWCPNCMDEMAFLSEYYRKNRDRGVEIIALAYELSTDVERSRKSLLRFQKQFNVEYPILNTGVTVGDKQRTEKTLPQLTEISVFPTSIILDKEGLVKEINTAFYGPGTGEYYTAYKSHFEKTINALLTK